MEPMRAMSGPRAARVRSWPRSLTDPAVGSSSPSSIFMVVDLPDPLGPRKP